MTCLEVKELLSAFIDNELDEDIMKKIQEHIEKCTLCNQEVLELKKIMDELSSLEDVPVPEVFNKRLHEALAAEGQKIRNSKTIYLNKKKWFSFKRISSIAAVFLVGLFSVILYNNNLDEFNKQNLDYSHVAEENTTTKGGLQSNDSVQRDTDENIDNSTQSNSSNKTNGQSKDSGVNKGYNTNYGSINSNESNSTDSSVQESSALEEPDLKFRSAPKQTENISDQQYRTFDSINESENLKSKNTEIDNKEVSNYLELLGKLLTESNYENYEINSCTQNDEKNMWIIDITIITIDSEGKEVKENAVYYGKDGRIWKKEL